MTNEFEAIRAAELSDPTVTTARMFGTDCLKVAGKVYAMEFHGALVVKLSRARAEALVAARSASVFDLGHGRPMKQWIVVPCDGSLDWTELVGEARAVVRER